MASSSSSSSCLCSVEHAPGQQRQPAVVVGTGGPQVRVSDGHLVEEDAAREAIQVGQHHRRHQQPVAKLKTTTTSQHQRQQQQRQAGRLAG